MDFDEQITGAIERLLADAECGPPPSGRPLLLVDEFQDLAPAHLLLLRLGVARAVGLRRRRRDQTIYGFSGATPSG